MKNFLNIIVACVFLLLPNIVFAAAGELDLSFGGDGFVLTTFPTNTNLDYVESLAVQEDGKILAAGYANHYTNFYKPTVVRYNVDGSLDTSFGTGGIAFTTITSSHDYCKSMVLQPDGKILLAGYALTSSSYDFNLVRYNSDGSLDTNFGSDGIVSTNVGIDDRAYGVVVQKDGKILAVGSRRSERDIALLRYNPDGSLDTSFGSAGIVLTDVAAGVEETAHDMTIQKDGKIVVTGQASITGMDVFLLRFNADGSLDTSFDSDGIITTDLGSSYAYGYSVTTQKDNKILVAGKSYNGSASKIALVRFNEDGSFDTSFGLNGVVTTGDSNSSPGYFGESVITQPDSKILVAGHGWDPSVSTTSNFLLVRYNPDGSLDTSFGGDGIVSSDISDKADYAQTLTLQDDGRIIVAGGGGNSFPVARYLPGNDSDSDGYYDNVDLFPSDPNEWFDADGDGVGDNADAFPNDPAASVDTDGDGYPDAWNDGKTVEDSTTGLTLDAFPNDIAASMDLDSDGKPEMWNYGYTPQDSTTGLTLDTFCSAWDTTFGTSGRIDEATGGRIALGLEGSIFHVKGAVVRKYNTDGTLDTDFGSSGQVILPAGNSDGRVSVQPDGKVVIVGDSTASPFSDIYITRLNIDGSIDTTLGTVGQPVYSIEPVSTKTLYVSDSYIDSSGNIFVTGTYTFISNPTDPRSYPFILKVNNSGTVEYYKQFQYFDPLYSNLNIHSPTSGRAIILHNNGNVFVGGGSETYSERYTNLLVYQVNNSHFWRYYNFYTKASAVEIIVDFASDSAGNILAVEEDWYTTSFNVLKYNQNGGYVSSFGTNGVVKLPMVSANDKAASLFIQTDDKVVVSGTSGGVYTLARLTENGSADSTFGVNGVFSDSNSSGTATQVYVLDDGKLLASGSSGIVRYVGNIIDTDSDGIPDIQDLDDDGDGVADTEDAFPNDPAASVDTDGDGYPDSWNTGKSASDSTTGLALDAFPADGTEWADADGDGVGDHSDAFPNDATEAIDTDDDGIGDNSDNCPDTSNASQADNDQDGLGDVCDLDDDNDGYSDFLENQCGNDPTAGAPMPGDLDISFGNCGHTLSTIGGDDDIARDIAIQDDGKFVVVGDSLSGSYNKAAVARYNTDGSLDLSFGVNGKVLIDYYAGSDVYLSVAIQADGKIIAAGYGENLYGNRYFLVTRFNIDGTLDTSFDGDGYFYAHFGLTNQTDSLISDLILQPDQKIVLVGHCASSSPFRDYFGVMRLNPDGSLDTTFSGDGKVATDITQQISTGTWDQANSVALQDDGKIVVAGQTYIDFDRVYDFAVVRYNSNGSLDTSFNGNGKVVKHFGYNADYVYDVQVLPNNKILASGRAYILPGSYDFAAIRLNSDGTLDSSFNNNGFFTLGFGGSPEDVRGTIILPDGKLLFGGLAAQDGIIATGIAVVNWDGSLDESFGNSGTLVYGANVSNAKSFSLVSQSDGKIVFAGQASNGSNTDFALIRIEAISKDLDHDKWTDVSENACETDPNDADSIPIDTDGDWSCNLIDADDDNDGVDDSSDAFPTDPAASVDTDGDGYPDAWNDGKTVDDSTTGLTLDVFPADETEWADSDGDGVGDNSDAFPNDATETVDTDGDGIGDNAEAFPTDPAASVDSDGDGYPDAWNAGKSAADSTTGLILDAFPTDPSASVDNDGDGYPDSWNVGKTASDSTTGLTLDAFPGDATESADTDGDGVGDNADAFPTDPAASVDSDSDGYPESWNTGKSEADSTTGLTLDPCPSDPTNDADSDGICGAVDVCPLDANNDADGDGFCGDVDNCNDIANADQNDVDSDSIGDACDSGDYDADGLMDKEEWALGTHPGYQDSDCDTIIDSVDVEPLIPADTAAPDFSCDYSSDILFQNSDDGSLQVWSIVNFDRSSIFSPKSIAYYWDVVGKGDFNGDGNSDVLYLRDIGETAVALMSHGQRYALTFPGGIRNTVWSVQGVGDFDGDGVDDLLWRRSTDNVTMIWGFKDGKRVNVMFAGALADFWVVKGVGDFNGDGKDDILFQHNSDGRLLIWELTNLRRSSIKFAASMASDWIVVGVGDFNDDGTDDVLYRKDTGDTAIAEFSNLNRSALKYPGVIGTAWSVEDVGDYNGDGTDDILFSRDSDNQTAIWGIENSRRTTVAWPGGLATQWVVH